MKKYLWLFAAILAAFCLLFTFSACGGNDDDPETPDDPNEPVEPDDPNNPNEPGEPGDPDSTLPVIFGNGKWTKEVGEVDLDTNITFTDGKLVFAKADEDNAFIQFENAVDATGYTQLVLEFEETYKDWAGGQIYMYYEDGYDDEGETLYSAQFGHWGCEDANGKNTKKYIYFFADLDEADAPDDGSLDGKFDPALLYGFTWKCTEGVVKTLIKISLEK